MGMAQAMATDLTNINSLETKDTGDTAMNEAETCTTEAMQLEAVLQDGHAIRYIQNPSETLQIIAVQQTGYAINCIQNPSEKVQLAAVRQTSYALQYIQNPSEAIQLAAAIL